MHRRVTYARQVQRFHIPVLSPESTESPFYKAYVISVPLPIVCEPELELRDNLKFEQLRRLGRT